MVTEIHSYDVAQFLREAHGADDPAIARARAHLVLQRRQAEVLEVLLGLLEYRRDEEAA